MATKVTEDLIVKMNELYLSIGTYSGVSKALGGTPSPSTVKKYIIPGYQPQESIVENHSEIIIPEFNPKMFDDDNLHWNPHLIPTEEERAGIEELWKELLI